METQGEGSLPAASRSQGAGRRPEQGGHLKVALLEACARLDRDAIAAGVARGAPLEARDALGRTPLGIVAAHGDVEAVRTLLDAGADPNARSAGGPAAGLGSAAARLVAAREGEEVRTPLCLAVESGEIGAVRLLLARGARPISGGATSPLELAVLLGDAEMIRALLDAGADPNARDSDADTPLMIAAAAGVPEPIEALIEYGAIVSSRNDDGESALDVAARTGRSESYGVLSPHFSLLARMRARSALSRARRGRRPLGRALRLARMDRLQDDARHGRLAAVRKALASGVEPDARPFDDADTALALAAEGGHVSVVRALLEAGADPNLAAGGETPLQRVLGPRAVEPRARPDVVRALVQGGAEVDARDADGLTPLMRAVVDGRAAERTIRLLIALGADPSAEHPAGLTALDLAKADPAKADIARVLESLAKREPERPTTLGVATPATSRPGEGRPVASLRGLGNRGVSEVVLAVRAPIDDVAPALERLRGGRQWSRRIFDEEGFFPGGEGYLVYQLRGHAWTLVQTELLDRRALRAADAREMSRTLGCDALLLEICEPSEVLRYALYRRGERVEELGLLPRGANAFASSVREVDEAERTPAVDFVDETLAAWDLFVPGLGDDRLEALAREFSPEDFERVDFLRIDEEPGPGGER